MKPPLIVSLITLAWLALFSQSQASAVSKPSQTDKPNFSGSWTLDLKASSSLEALMNQIGASFVERKYANSVTLKAILNQTGSVLTIAARGPGFALDQTLYLDGSTRPGNLNLLGATSRSTRTGWSDHQRKLVETHQIRTKAGKGGQLIIERHLTDGGKTIVANYTLKLDGDPNQTSARQIWRRQA